MRWLIVLCLVLGACSSVELDEVISAGAATAGATVGTVLAGPAAGAVIGAGAGTAAIVVTPETAPPLDVTEIMNPWQAFAVAFNELLNHAFEIVIAIGVATVGLPMLLSFAAGKVIPRGKEKETMSENKVLKKMMEEKDARSNHPDHRSGHRRSNKRQSSGVSAP